MLCICCFCFCRRCRILIVFVDVGCVNCSVWDGIGRLSEWVN